MARVPPPTEKDGTHVLTRQERHALNDILGAEKTSASRAEETSASRADDKGHDSHSRSGARYRDLVHRLKQAEVAKRAA